MQCMATKSNSRKDFTQIAYDVVQQATGEAERKTELTGKKADSSTGGLKGGMARASRLTPEQKVRVREVSRSSPLEKGNLGRLVFIAPEWHL